MDGLEAPDLAAGLGIESHERGGVLVLGFRSVRTPIICRGVAERQIDKPKRLITARGRPHVGCSAGIGLSFGWPTCSVRMLHVPGPAQRAGNCIETLHYARWRIRALAVENLLSGDDHAPDDGRRRGDRHHARSRFAHSDCDIDSAVLAEIHTRRSCARINGNQPRVERACNDACRACAGGIGLWHRVKCDAATRSGIGNASIGNPWIIAPTLRTGGSVERDKYAAPRTQVHGIAYFDRRRFRTPALPRYVARAEGPCAFESAHVLSIDLIERRVTLRVVGAAVGGPIAAGLHERGVRHRLRKWFGHCPSRVRSVGLGYCNAQYDQNERKAAECP